MTAVQAHARSRRTYDISKPVRGRTAYSCLVAMTVDGLRLIADAPMRAAPLRARLPTRWHVGDLAVHQLLGGCRTHS